MDDVSLSITILCNGTINTETVSSLLDNFTNLPIRKHVGFIIGGYPAYSRNLAVKAALEHKVSHLMFIDGDQTFQGDGIKRLIEQKKDIIGANYNQRSIPLVSTVKLMDDKGNMVGSKDGLTRTPLPDEPFKAYAVATGFMLINLAIFDKIPYPWFNTELEPTWKTEDIYFCENARKSGFDVWCDPRIKVGHIGSYVY